MVIRGDRIVAASVVLPLTDNISATGQLGTRHRAGIGITEESDALAVVVSEETGQIAVAHNGRLIRNLDQDRLRRVLRSLLRLDRLEGRPPQSGGGWRALLSRYILPTGPAPLDGARTPASAGAAAPRVLARSEQDKVSTT